MLGHKHEISHVDDTMADDRDATLALAASYVPDSEEEKRLLRKIDRRLVPCIWGLYSASTFAQTVAPTDAW